MRVGRVIQGLVYVGAGVLHFVLTRQYERIMPGYLPAHRELVLVSGAAEIAGGLGLLVPQTREGWPGRAAAWGLVVLLVAVMPANVTMVTENSRFPGVPLWAAWARLPLQVPLVWWAWRYTRRVAWEG